MFIMIDEVVRLWMHFSFSDLPFVLHQESNREPELHGFHRSLLLDSLAFPVRVHWSHASSPLCSCQVRFVWSDYQVFTLFKFTLPPINPKGFYGAGGELLGKGEDLGQVGAERFDYILIQDN